MIDALRFLRKLNELMPCDAEHRHAITLDGSGRPSIVVWMLEVVVIPPRCGFREFFPDENDLAKLPEELAAEIVGLSILAGGAPLRKPAKATNLAQKLVV